MMNGTFALCALAIAGMMARREFFPASPAVADSPKVQIANWREYRKGHAVGAPAGRVSLVVFSDYECPACRKLAFRLDTIQARFPNQLTIYYRNFPLPYHRKARVAAFAAECAAREGAFERAHALLFADVDSIGVRSWARFAALSGVADTLRFSRCVQDSLPAAVVATDQADAGRLNLQVTPTLLLDSLMLRGLPSATELEALIQRSAETKTSMR